MKWKLSRIQTYIVILLTVTLLAGAAWGYLFVLKPLEQEYDQAVQTLKMEKQLLAALRQKEQPEGEFEKTELSGLLEQLPVYPNLLQMFAEIHQAEQTSGSNVKSYQILTANEENEENSKSFQTPEELIQQLQKGQQEQKNQQIQGENQSEEQNKDPLQRITFKLFVETGNFQQMMNFIEHLEKSRRLMTVDALQFQRPNEPAVPEEGVEASPPVFTFTLELSGYYINDFHELYDQVPKIELPEPGLSLNPFESE
ncbi:MAG: hypothetical protein H0Z32_11730 [Bacillaceae bacterium]|nr:hypothetical protein [Bacillaceae bacterium]